MDHRAVEIRGKANGRTSISVMKGHFATNHSHINYYIDMTKMKHNHVMAHEAARTLAAQYKSSALVDTVACMDGTEIIGGFLAYELAKAEFGALNQDTEICAVAPEYNSNSQMIFRDNVQPMIYQKHIVLLMASVTTGKTIRRSVECIKYYGGILSGISALFSASDEVAGIAVHHLFSASELPDYHTYPFEDCPDCRANHKIDAIVNSFGYSEI